jgi:hypothetical protein
MSLLCNAIFKRRGRHVVAAPCILAVLLSSPAWAGKFCVGDEAEAQQALEAARTNNQADLIRFKQGLQAIASSLVYDTSTMDSDHHQVTISGGYDDTCSNRTGTTVLDGQDQIAPLNLRLQANDSVIVDHMTFYRSAECGLCAEMQSPDVILRIDSNRFLYGSDPGGLWVAGVGSELRVRNSLFVGNHSVSASAVHISFDGPVYFVNNTVARNTASGNGEAVVYAGPWTDGGDFPFSIANNIIWENELGADGHDMYLAGGSHYALSGNDIGTYQSGPTATLAEDDTNLSQDPQLSECGVICTDLLPRPNSPVVNAGIDTPDGGVPDTDILGLPRILGIHIDIGAYEVDAIFTDGFQ